MSTVSNDIRIRRYTLASDSAGPFEVQFRIFENDAVRVLLNGVETTAFTMTADFAPGYDDNAHVTLSTAAASGTVIEIYGDRDTSRDETYIGSEANLVAKINAENARLTASVIEARRDNNRSLRVLDMSGEVSPIALTAAQRANAVPRFTADGLGFDAFTLPNPETGAVLIGNSGGTGWDNGVLTVSGTGTVIPRKRTFTITDPAGETTFTLDGDPVTSGQLHLFLDGEYLDPTLYSTVGTTLTLTTPIYPPAKLHSVLFEPVTQAISLTNTSFQTKAEAIAAGVFADGTVIHVNGRGFRAEASASSVPNLPGYVPLVWRIMTLGTSLTLDAQGRANSWPDALGEAYRDAGVPCEVINVAQGGATMVTMDSNLWGNGTKSQIDRISEVDPDVVLVDAFYNSAYTAFDFDGITPSAYVAGDKLALNQSRLETEFDALVVALKAATAAPIYFLRTVTWDDSSGSVDAEAATNPWPNRLAFAKGHSQLDAGEPYAGVTGSGRVAFHSSYYDKVINPHQFDKARCLAHIQTYMNTACAADAQLNRLSTKIHLYRMTRLGLHTDALHLDRMAHLLIGHQAAYDLATAEPDMFGEFLTTKAAGNELYLMNEVWDAMTTGLVLTGARVINGYTRDYSLKESLVPTIFNYQGYPWTLRFRNWIVPHFRDFAFFMPTDILNAGDPVTMLFDGLPGGTSEVSIWNPGTGTFQDGFNQNFDTTVTDTERGSGYVYTYTFDKRFSANIPEGETREVAFRFQNAQMPDGIDFIEVWGNIEVHQRIIHYGIPLVTFGGGNTGLTQAGVVAVTGITAANPGVVTATGHGISGSGEIILSHIADGGNGSTDISTLNNRKYAVTEVDANNLSLTGIDTSGLSAWASGGYISTGITNRTTYHKAALPVEWATNVTLTAKGSSTGDALIDPDIPNKLGDRIACMIGGYSGMSSATLTHADFDNTGVTLKSSGAAASVTLTDANFTDTTAVNFGGAYAGNS